MAPAIWTTADHSQKLFLNRDDPSFPLFVKVRVEQGRGFAVFLVITSAFTVIDVTSHRRVQIEEPFLFSPNASLRENLRPPFLGGRPSFRYVDIASSRYTVFFFETTPAFCLHPPPE